MVSVVFPIGPSFTPERLPQGQVDGCASAPPPITYASGITQQATCQFFGRPAPALASILHGTIGQGRMRMMSLMYQAYQNHMDLTAPWRTGAAQALRYLNLVPQGVSDKLFGRLAAALELISRTSLTYSRPAY